MKISQARVDGLIDDAKKIKISGGITTKDIKLGGNIKIGGGSGTNNYEQLINKPQINDVEVIGNKSIEDYGVKTLSNLEIKQIFDRIFNKGGN